MGGGEGILEGEMNCVARDCRECMDGRSRRARQGSQGTTRDDREGATGRISARVEAFGRRPVRAQTGQRQGSGTAAAERLQAVIWGHAADGGIRYLLTVGWESPKQRYASQVGRSEAA
jgi:hypothetical protein